MSRPHLTLHSAPPSDPHEIARRFQEGDRRAFGILVAPELDALYTLCLRVLGRAADAEEVAQEALERALLAHRRYDPNRPFRVWLFTIAINRCRDRMRGPWWARVFRMESAPPQLTPSCAALLERMDEDGRVRELLLQLPPIYREALSLYHLEDMSYAEMSEILGVAEPALKQRVRRGREMLRQMIDALYPEMGLARREGTEASSPPCPEPRDARSS